MKKIGGPPKGALGKLFVNRLKSNLNFKTKTGGLKRRRRNRRKRRNRRNRLGSSSSSFLTGASDSIMKDIRESLDGLSPQDIDSAGTIDITGFHKEMTNRKEEKRFDNLEFLTDTNDRKCV
jgi:hypothetical protein